MGLILRNTTTGTSGGTDQAQEVNLSTTTAAATGASTVDEAIAILTNQVIAILANQTIVVNSQTEEVTLDNLPAETWTNFPEASFAYTDWKIYENDIKVGDDFLIRDDNGIKQILSSVAKTNLKFVFST